MSPLATPDFLNQSLRHAAAAKSSKLDGGNSAAVAGTASRAELLGRVLRRLHVQLLLPRCMNAWASSAAAAAAAWAEKEVDAPRNGRERLGLSPVPDSQTQMVKGQVVKGQVSRGPLLKGQTVDSSTQGWFNGGSASPPTEPAGAITRTQYSHSSSVTFSFLVRSTSMSCPFHFAVFTLKSTAAQASSSAPAAAAQLAASRRTPPVLSSTHVSAGKNGYSGFRPNFSCFCSAPAFAWRYRRAGAFTACDVTGAYLLSV